MARDKLTEYSATASENTVCGDVNIAENSALPSDMNNFAREVMSHLKAFSDGTDAITGLTVDGNIKLDGNYPTGTNNVALGNTALDASTGNYNTAIGANALTNNTAASNTAVGNQALETNTSGTRNVAVGSSAGYNTSTGERNTAVGTTALYSNTTADNNTAVGDNALFANTTGADNVAVGYNTLTANTTAGNNVGVGNFALYSTTTGGNNAAFGDGALLTNTTGIFNTGVGNSALRNSTTSSNNTSVGYNSLLSNTTGADNTAVGKNAGEALTTANQNCLIGSGAGKLITTGANNTVIGGYTGNQGGLDIRTASNRIVLSDGDGNPRLISTNAGHIIINETAQNLGQGGGWGQIAVEANATNIHAGKFGGQGTGTTTSVVAITCPRSSGSGFSFLEAFSGMTSETATGDREFVVRGDGNVAADDSFNGGGADYAEFFEWNDGNTTNEDRRGYSVVLVNNKVRKATASDAAADIIGVVSATPTVVGDAAWNRWNEKYLRDDYGSYLTETYTVTRWTENDVDYDYPTDEVPSDLTVPSDATVHTQDENGVTFTRRRLNPDYDATQTYTPRSERQEWDTIGLMGKLRLRAGQPTGDRWIKMRDVATDSDGNVTVEEWLVR
jgi:hypothetical protein